MGVPSRSACSLNGVDDVRRACRETADRLDQAQSVEEFRRALSAQQRLWRTLRDHLGEADLPVPPDERKGLRDEADFILESCDGPGSPSDMQIEAFIAINRRVARRLARLCSRPAAPALGPHRPVSVTRTGTRMMAGYPL